MVNNKKIFCKIICFILFLFFIAEPALAQSDIGKVIGTGLKIAQEEVGWEDSASLDIVVLNIINLVMGFLGLLSITITLYGGFVWMTSGGNEDKISKAKKIIIAGIIGLAIIMSAYAISKWVLDNLVKVTAP